MRFMLSQAFWKFKIKVNAVQAILFKKFKLLIRQNWLRIFLLNHNTALIKTDVK